MTNETTTLLAGAAQAEPDASPTFADRIPAQSQVLYGSAEVLHREALRGHEQTLLETLTPTATAKAEVADLTPLIGRYASNANDGKVLIDAFSQAHRTPVTAEQSTAWRQEAMQAMREEFGDRAGDVMAATKAMVLRDPQLAARLNKANISNNPRVVLLLARKAVQR